MKQRCGKYNGVCHRSVYFLLCYVHQHTAMLMLRWQRRNKKRKQFDVDVDFDGAQKAWRDNKIIEWDKNHRGQTIMTGFQYKCLPYEEAKKKVHALGLKDAVEWRRWSRSPERPLDIPIIPWKTYKNAGWKGMADWLGIGKKKLGSKLEKNEEENEDKKKDNEKNNMKNKSMESLPH